MSRYPITKFYNGGKLRMTILGPKLVQFEGIGHPDPVRFAKSLKEHRRRRESSEPKYVRARMLEKLKARGLA
jgi:hypothetical protein